MLLIAGLGNPGPEHAGNRHNIGFMALDVIHRDPSFSPWSRKFQGEVSEGRIGGEKVLLLKPLTFMNLSGQSVAAAANFFKLEPGQIVVLHDELDLPPGKVRVKTGGGNGGHNGLRSIDSHLGKDYRRVRLGIGHPGHKDRVSPFVLSDFAKSDRDWLEPLLGDLARYADLLVKGEDAQLMNRLALASGSVEPPSARGSAEGSAMKASGGAGPKNRSHIRQARPGGPQAPMPQTGPLAGMLRKLFGDKS